MRPAIEQDMNATCLSSSEKAEENNQSLTSWRKRLTTGESLIYKICTILRSYSKGSEPQPLCGTSEEATRLLQVFQGYRMD